MKIKDLTVEKVLVTVAADIGSEAYVGIIVDRATKKPVFMVSAAGGIDIEQVAAETPEKILYLPVDTRYGLLPYDAMRMGFFLYEDVKLARGAAKIMQQLYAAFMASGCSLAEINPLVVTPQGELVAVDGKMVIDDNELDRLPAIAALRDESSEEPSEVGAQREPHVHQARRQRGLRGERRGPGDGDDGPGEVLRRRAGELPRHRRVVEPGEGRERAADHHRRPEREGDPVQHLRRHHAHR
jgi:hypothetical protein